MKITEGKKKEKIHAWDKSKEESYKYYFRCMQNWKNGVLRGNPTLAEIERLLPTAIEIRNRTIIPITNLEKHVGQIPNREKFIEDWEERMSSYYDKALIPIFEEKLQIYRKIQIGEDKIDDFKWKIQNHIFQFDSHAIKRLPTVNYILNQLMIVPDLVELSNKEFNIHLEKICKNYFGSSKPTMKTQPLRERILVQPLKESEKADTDSEIDVSTHQKRMSKSNSSPSIVNPKHPGKIILDELLKPNNVKIKEAAKMLGVARGGFSFLINGHYGLSPEMAIKISDNFSKYSAEELLSFQNAWDLAQARTKMSLEKPPTYNLDN